MCATPSCITFTFMHCICVRYTLVVRHDLCLIVVSKCHVFWLILPLLPRFYSDVLMSLVLYPVVFHSHIWMQDVGLG